MAEIAVLTYLRIHFTHKYKVINKLWWQNGRVIMLIWAW